MAKDSFAELVKWWAPITMPLVTQSPKQVMDELRGKMYSAMRELIRTSAILSSYVDEPGLRFAALDAGKILMVTASGVHIIVYVEFDDISVIIDKMYGYPDCCVAHHNGLLQHETDWRLHQAKYYLGTGYIPCPKCIKRDQRELMDVIHKRRLIQLPFPQDAQDSVSYNMVYVALAKECGVEVSLQAFYVVEF